MFFEQVHIGSFIWGQWQNEEWAAAKKSEAPWSIHRAMSESGIEVTSP